jgi:hypothetical protein
MPDPRMNFLECPDGPAVLRLRQESPTPPRGHGTRGHKCLTHERINCLGTWKTTTLKRPINLHEHELIPPQKKTINRQGLGDLAKTATDKHMKGNDRIGEIEHNDNQTKWFHR